MILFKSETYMKIIKYTIVIFGMALMTGCASSMKINMNVDAESSTMDSDKSLAFHKDKNILVIVTQGESNQKFASRTPDSIGNLVMKYPLNYCLFPVTESGGKFSFDMPIDEGKSISIYVVGKGLDYQGDSQWKYYFNTLQNNTLNLHILNEGVIEKVKT